MTTVPRRRMVPTVVVAAAMLAVILPALPAGAALAISVPPSANLGSVPTGTSSLSAPLGTVTVTATGLVAPSFTATVSATDFTTGTGAADERIPRSSISYWSGPATATSGLNTATPGQPTALQAQSLSSPRTAFSATGLLLSISCSWNPTIVVAIPAAAVQGTYAGTITHSVA